jgi:hypothetical protein
MSRIQVACYSLIASAFLLAGLLITQVEPNSARGAMVVSEQSFAMMTAQTRPGEEGLFVLDNNTGRLLIYRFDVPNDRIRLQRNINLNRLLAGGDGGR